MGRRPRCGCRVGPFGSEHQRLVVLEDQGRLEPGLPVFDFLPLVVVVDRAVLEDFDECGALVGVGAVQGLLEMGCVDVDGAGDEGRAGAEGEGDRIDRVIDGALRARLGAHSLPRGR